MPAVIHHITAVRVYFLEVATRVPLKFGPETLTTVTCARVCMEVVDDRGKQAAGWGETPLSVQWVWPCALPYAIRHAALRDFIGILAARWLEISKPGHPIEIGHYFNEIVLPACRREFNEGFLRSAGRQQETGRALGGEEALTPPLSHLMGEGGDARFAPSKPLISLSSPEEERGGVRRHLPEGSSSPMPPDDSANSGLPLLAALVCNSAFDIALHDAFANLVDRPVYQTYGPEFLSTDLSKFLEPAPHSGISFAGKYVSDFLVSRPPQQLEAWHLVGGLDLLETSELTGSEPADGHPILLPDWIKRDGLKCLKVKLRGNDSAWDYQRLVKVGEIGIQHGVKWLSADFNCTVQDPAYVNEILDRLRKDQKFIWDMLLYVEQPFPYELENHRVDVRGVSARKPLFLDESAHDWRLVRLGKELGWTGVALKTCKTQTGALLSACWAKAHGMALMVQDLTNPMLAQIPHVQLAANVGTIMGVETNSMQFYPAASAPEAAVHPGLYQRRNGKVDLSSIRGSGFGYRLPEIHRALPAPALSLGT